MKPDIGPIELDAELAHARIERVGRNRIRRLRSTFEIDFAEARKVRIREGVAFGQNREPALARREARLRRVEILALRKRNEVVDRSRVGGEVAGSVDAGEIDPAAECQCYSLVADLPRRAWIEWCRLVGGLRLSARDFRLRLELLFLPPLLLHTLFELLQPGLERAHLGCRIVLRQDLASRNHDAADNDVLQ